MESITIVKLTKTECAVLSRAVEILEELETHATCHRLADTGEVICGLGNLLSELAEMGNEFSYYASEEEEEEEIEEVYEDEDCYEFIQKRSDYAESLTWKGTVPESY